MHTRVEKNIWGDAVNLDSMADPNRKDGQKKLKKMPKLAKGKRPLSWFPRDTDIVLVCSRIWVEVSQIWWRIFLHVMALGPMHALTLPSRHPTWEFAMAILIVISCKVVWAHISSSKWALKHLALTPLNLRSKLLLISSTYLLKHLMKLMMRAQVGQTLSNFRQLQQL